MDGVKCGEPWSLFPGQASSAFCTLPAGHTGNHCDSSRPGTVTWRQSRRESSPVSISDLRARLELLTKYGVRTYRDGILSLDLDPERLRKKAEPRPDDQPDVPEM